MVRRRTLTFVTMMLRKHAGCRRLCAATLAIAAAIPGTAHYACAAPLPRLVVHRTPDASDCPDAFALATAVAHHMHRPALDPAGTNPSTPLYEVDILRSGQGYDAVLRAGDLTRRLSDPGSTCDALAGAAALTLAILLDITPPVRPSDSSAVERPPAVPAAPRQRHPQWGVTFDLGAAQTLGYLTPLSFAATGELAFRFRTASLGVGALWVPTRVVDVDPGTVHIWLAGATLRFCAAVVGDVHDAHLSIGLQTLIGAIHGEGHGYGPDRRGTAPWIMYGATTVVEGPVGDRMGWTVRVSSMFPLLASKFTVSSGGGGSTGRVVTAFEPLPANLLIGVGLRVTIW